MKSEKKTQYGIWDNLHDSWFYFKIENEKNDFFDTREEAEEAMNLCKMLFFSYPHDFVVKEKMD